MLSRRTTGRFFLFRPDVDGTIQNICVYCIGLFTALFGIEVHVVTVLSNHVHLVLTDTRGNFPVYLERCHRILALATKCYRGWDGSVFDRSQTSMVELPTATVIIEKMAYVIVNGVAAGAVYESRDWPGVRTIIDDIGCRAMRAVRPKWFFIALHWPATVELPLVWPAAVLAEMTPDQARAALKEAVRRLEKQARAEVRDRGDTFIGPERVMRASITARGTASEPRGTRNPTFATAGDGEVHQAMVEKRREFRASYRTAHLGFANGDRDVLYPYGTWKMRVLFNVQVTPAPS
jgi:hypothetical protein